MLFLIGLIFFSKIAFSFIPGVPSELGPFIYQSGLHPYLNIALSVLVGTLLLTKKLFRPDGFQLQSRLFRFFIVLSCLFLLFITLMQMLFLKADESIWLQLMACLLSIFMIYLFGRVLPTQLKPEKFIEVIRKITVFLCWMSLIALILSPATSFKGGRFIGVFKHIPHMVSCATLACSMLLYNFFILPQSRRQKVISALSFVCAFALLVLTGTRSALAATLVSLILALILFPSRSQGAKFLKVSLAVTSLLVGTLFGDDVINYSIQIVRGEQTVGLRAAQDGVATRLEEFERGSAIFQENPWLGHGLLSKFSSVSETEVSGYNANKDPHNIFISAGVVGGWGLVGLAVFGYSALLMAALRKLLSPKKPLQILAIYILTQMPILFIYHIHLSLGGIADRIYWVVFGYMALREERHD